MEKILSVAVPSIFRTGLDYLPLLDLNVDALQPGMRVRVPLGSRQATGILLGVKSKTDFPHSKLKPIIEVLDCSPLLSNELLELYQWVAKYYHHPIGEVILGTLPAKLRSPKPAVLKKKPQSQPWLFEKPLHLNQEQQQAVDSILSISGYHCFLLDGVTGSGKTEVYMHVIEQVLLQSKQVLVLVPEIALTPQTMSRFSQRFSVPVVALHSGLAAGARLQNWLLCQEPMPMIVIGTRSSIFAPFLQLGLIVIDEEHDLSFKQQSGLRYSARDVAIKRASQLAIPIILGSATPSFESLYNCQQGKSTHLRLTHRVGAGVMPSLQVIDLRVNPTEAGLTSLLTQAIEHELELGNQVLLFLNRRGFAPVMLCHHCGWVVRCHHCESNLVWHKRRQRLICHHCDLRRQPPPICPQCEQANLIPIGVGTEQLESTLAERFSGVEVIRIDRDTTRRKNSLEDKLSQLKRGEPAILVGTQMLTKGHHFPKLTLVGMIEVDSALMGVDFRAQERFAQQLIQVAGRAGRAEQLGRVLIQTYQPDNGFLQCLIKQGYGGIVTPQLQQRHDCQYPPYAFMAMLQADSRHATQAEQFLCQLKRRLKVSEGQTVVQGPVPAPLEKVRGRYRSQLMIKSDSRQRLHALLCQFPALIKGIYLSRSVRWSLDVDPQTLS